MKVCKSFRLVQRWCKWTGIDGNTYEKNRYIDAIFYNMDMVKDRDPYLSTNNGGGLRMEFAIDHINRVYKGKDKVTEAEVKEAIEQVCRQIEAGNTIYDEYSDDYCGGGY